MVLLLAIVSFGCGQQESITKYSVPKETETPVAARDEEPAAKPTAWFFKLQGPADDVTAVESQFTGLVESVKFENKKPTWSLPVGWSETSYTQMRFATLSVDDADPPFSFWRTVYKPPEHEAKVEIVDKENPETLLSRMVEEDEAHTENARYILAVMLERKKLLVETDSQKAKTGLLRIYEHRNTGEVFIVKDPQIPLSEIGPIQEEVQALLAPKGEPEIKEAEPDQPEGEDASSEEE